MLNDHQFWRLIHARLILEDLWGPVGAGAHADLPVSSGGHVGTGRSDDRHGGLAG